MLGHGLCIRLIVTAGGRNYLKSLPLARLREYVDAYNIKVDRIIEKDDIVLRIMAARVNFVPCTSITDRLKAVCSRVQTGACHLRMRYEPVTGGSLLFLSYCL